MTGDTVKFFSPGTCTLDATQVGNAAWSAASASQSFPVAAAPSPPGGSGSGGGPTPPPATLPPLPPTIPTGTFGTPATGTASATRRTAITDTFGRASATVHVPAGALPAGTTVSVTPVVHATAIDSLIPTGDAYVTSFAVSWQAPDGSSPAARAPITLKISDPSIVAGDVVYEVTATGSLRAVGKATRNHTVTITFSKDPVFVVAAPPKLALSKKHALVNRQAVRVSLRCVRGSTCKGTASIRIVRVIREDGKPVLKRGKKTYAHLVLAKTRFTITKRRGVTLKLTMTKLGKSLLSRTERRIVRVTLVTVVRNGSRTAQPLRLTY